MLRRVSILAVLGVVLAAPSLAAGPGNEAPPPRYTYCVAGDDSLAAFVFNPPQRGEKPTSAILLFHGGGWSAGSADWVFASAQRFAQWGLIAIAIDYRLSGENVTPIDAFDDVCHAFAWTRAHAAELGVGGKIAGYGVSAGAHLLALTATIGCGEKESRPDAMLLWSPALDVARDGHFTRLLQGRGKAADYSPADHVSKNTPPTCIVHGAEDTLTPLTGSQRFCEAMIAAGGTCELNVYPGVGHLLTRNLAYQEDDFDPDPEKRADGIEKQRQFLLRLGLIVESK